MDLSAHIETGAALSAVQTLVEHLETSSTSTSDTASTSTPLQGGGPGGDSSQPEELREVTGGETPTRDKRSCHVTERDATTWKSCFLHQTQCGRPLSPQPPWEPKTLSKYEGKVWEDGNNYTAENNLSLYFTLWSDVESENVHRTVKLEWNVRQKNTMMSQQRKWL